MGETLCIWRAGAGGTGQTASEMSERTCTFAFETLSLLALSRLIKGVRGSLLYLTWRGFGQGNTCR